MRCPLGILLWAAAVAGQADPVLHNRTGSSLVLAPKWEDSDPAIFVLAASRGGATATHRVDFTSRVRPDIRVHRDAEVSFLFHSRPTAAWTVKGRRTAGAGLGPSPKIFQALETHAVFDLRMRTGAGEAVSLGLVVYRFACDAEGFVATQLDFLESLQGLPADLRVRVAGEVLAVERVPEGSPRPCVIL